MPNRVQGKSAIVTGVVLPLDGGCLAQ